MFLDKWEESVQMREGFTNAQGSKMLLSVPTRLYLYLKRIFYSKYFLFIVLAFTELVESIFKNSDVTVFLRNRIYAKIHWRTF